MEERENWQKRATGKAAWEVNIGKGEKWDETENKNHALCGKKKRGRRVSFERKCDEEIARKKGKRLIEGAGREKSISQSLFIKWCSATER